MTTATEQGPFFDKSKTPSESDLRSRLGPSFTLWKMLSGAISAWFPVENDWKFYSRKNGWIMRNLNGNRNLFFLVPRADHFELSFTFGESLLPSIAASARFPEAIRTQLAEAKPYAEGRSVLVRPQNEDDIPWILDLIKLKAHQ